MQVDLGMLAHMEVPEVAFIMVCDALMIVSGYASYVTTNPVAIWPEFMFSACRHACGRVR